MIVDNSELIEKVEWLKSNKIIKRDVEIADKMHYSKGNLSAYLNNKKQVPPAFLLRLDFADVFNLQWKTHIRAEGMVKPREKTEVQRITPLHASAQQILSMLQRKTKFVFQNLPNRPNRNYSWSACDKTLKALVKRAKINKHITWHCARHSFGTNAAGEDGTIAKLLGHADTSMVKIYRRVKDDKLRTAINSLQGIKLGK